MMAEKSGRGFVLIITVLASVSFRISEAQASERQGDIRLLFFYIYLSDDAWKEIAEIAVASFECQVASRVSLLC